MTNSDVNAARVSKSDEFYTQYEDIAAEMNAYTEYNPDVFGDKTILLPCDDYERSNFTKYFSDNFERLGIKKLISTCYAKSPDNQFSLFEATEEREDANGKIFVKEREGARSGRLQGNGDFRSEEVCNLRDSADFVITNPPFSLFREFMKWLTDGGKHFSVLGNINAVTCKDVFPLLKDDVVWLGSSIHSGDRKFNVPDDYPLDAVGCGIDPDGKKYIRVKGVRWFTNIEFGNRHKAMELNTAEQNLKNEKLLRKLEGEYGCTEYPRYDNYDAIEIPFTEFIPSDYDGTMGVPITFLDKYCPEQFEILWQATGNTYANAPREVLKYLRFDPTIKCRGGTGIASLKGHAMYPRMLIRRRNHD